jgi:predicted lipid-binding transport protein (Tim44 family)
MISLLSFGLIVNEASAKRFGGGRSFGVQRSNSSLFSSNKSYNNSIPNKNSSTKSRWGGVLGGLLAGGLLASLFMGNGFANGLMSWLLIGVVAFFVMNFLKRRSPALQGAQAGSSRPNNPFQNFSQAFTSQERGSHQDQSVQFDAESFLRQAKVTFYRMQTAYDQKNLHDLQAFTAPEVFAEIKMQLDERGDESNITEVISLDAKLLDVSKQSLSTMASVQFTGTVKENGELSQLDEIWHFRQFDGQEGWVVGGIQQEVFQA